MSRKDWVNHLLATGHLQREGRGGQAASGLHLDTACDLVREWKGHIS